MGATLKEVADHIDHIRSVCGGSCDHIGIGADYDGIVDVSRGLGNVSKVSKDSRLSQEHLPFSIVVHSVIPRTVTAVNTTFTDKA